MKLLKLEIGDLPKEKQFRSLHAGFKVEFHSLDTKGINAMHSFSPFCFAGLNGRAGLSPGRRLFQHVKRAGRRQHAARSADLTRKRARARARPRISRGLCTQPGTGLSGTRATDTVVLYFESSFRIMEHS